MESHEEAILSFERALAIKRSSLDDDDEDICILMQFIGTSLFSLERFAKSVEYFLSKSEKIIKIKFYNFALRPFYLIKSLYQISKRNLI
jgi:hypothetical protein